MREHIQVNVQTGERKVVPYTDEENAAADAAKAKQDAHEAEFGYINKRLAEYGTIQEQLEYIAENGADAFMTRQAAIKAKHPKVAK